MNRYSDRVLEHFQHPRHVGRVEPRDGIGRIGDPDCGDFLEVTVRLTEDHQNLESIGYLIKGCPAAIATASVMTELVEHRTVEEALQLTDQEVIDALDGLPPGKEHCSLLAVKGLHLALQDALIRRLFKKAGLAKDDEEFDRMVASGEVAEMLQFHTCDGSCEQAGGEATCPATPAGETPTALTPPPVPEGSPAPSSASAAAPPPTAPTPPKP
ncbi:MAG: hypothetical protein GX442_20290 [Candidatus Riflebacteria bacterium]|nr:hypothetical protein [Candidatus Riflebacteria bacterium]